MKKNIFILLSSIILTSFIPSSIFAQSNGLSFGIRSGINFSKISNKGDIIGIPLEDFTNNDPSSIKETWLKTKIHFRTTYSIGGFLEYYFNKKYSVILEFIYNNKGAIFNGEFFYSFIQSGYTLNNLIEINTTIELNYYSFPIFLKYTFPVNHEINPYIIIGPEIGYISKAKTSKIDWKNTGWFTDNPKSENKYETNGEDLKNYVEKIEYVINIGAGISYKTMGINIIFDGRYSMGISNINKIAKKDILSKMISLNIGVSTN